MNNLLLEKIKALIKESEEATMGQVYDGKEGGFRIFSGKDRGLRDDDPLSDPKKLKEARHQKSLGFIMDQLARYKVKKIGKDGKIFKYIKTYNNKLDHKDWVPRLVTFEDERIKNAAGETIKINITYQTREFLKNLLEKLFETKKDPELDTVKEEIPGLKISFEEVENSNGNITKILDSVNANFAVGIQKLKDIILNDERFNPNDVILKIRAPISGYATEQIEQIEQLYKGMADLTDISNIKTAINNLYVDIDITINTTSTLLPLYNNVNFVPRNSNAGALDKLAWSYQQLRDITSNIELNSISDIMNLFDPNRTLQVMGRYVDDVPTEINSIKDIKKALKKAKKALDNIASGTITHQFKASIRNEISNNNENADQATINKLVKNEINRIKSDDEKYLTNLTESMIRLLQAHDKLEKGSQTFVNRIDVDDITNEDAMSIGPLGLLAKGRRIVDRHEPLAIIVVTSDVGTGYIWRPPAFGENKDTLRKFAITFKGKETKFGKLLKDYFEGLISQERFLVGLESLNLTEDQRAIATRFIDDFIHQIHTKVYCFKLMYCDTVSVTYNMPLPKSIFDTHVGVQPMPDEIKVPGSENLPRTNSYVSTTKMLDTKKNISKLKTVSSDILKTGSGSLSFLSSIYKANSPIGQDKTGYEKVRLVGDFYYLYSMFKNVAYEYYVHLTEEQFNALKDGRTIVIDDGDDYTLQLNPNSSKSLKATLDSMGSYDTKTAYILKYSDGFRYNLAIEHLKILQNIFTQMLRQMESIGFNESKEGREFLRDIQTGFNTTIAGKPGTVTKIQKNMIVSINGSNSIESHISDAIIDHNLLEDAFSIIQAYFMSFHAKQEQQNQTDKIVNKFIPRLITGGTDRKGLDIAAARKGVHIDERNSLISQLDDYLNNGLTKLRSFFAADKDKIVSVMKSYRYLFDAIKLLSKVTMYDGVRMFEFNDIENIDHYVPAIPSKIDTKLKLYEIINSITDDSDDDSSPDTPLLATNREDAITEALKTATEADLKVGVAVSDFCKKNFGTLIKKIREMTSRIPDKKIPVTSTPHDARIPYMPIHTIITAFEEGGNIMFFIASSILSIKEGSSPYTYVFDKTDKEFKVEPDETTQKIQIEADDKDYVQNHVGRVDYAFCMFNMMSAKKTTQITLDVFSKLEHRAAIGYRDLKRYIENNNIFYGTNNVSDIKKTEIDNLFEGSVDDDASNRAATESDDGDTSAVSNIDQFHKIKNIIDIIAKYIVVTAILYDIQD